MCFIYSAPHFASGLVQRGSANQSGFCALSAGVSNELQGRTVHALYLARPVSGGEDGQAKRWPNLYKTGKQ